MANFNETWRKLYLGSVEDPQDCTRDLRRSFAAAYAAAKFPADMALFAKYSPSPSGRINVTVYFSPGAVHFARSRLGIMECPAPTKQDLHLLVGSETSWNLIPDDR